MGELRLFIDFGSTFTKVCAFDLEREELAGWAKAPSTVDTDVTAGLRSALEELKKQLPVTEALIGSAMGCSSAAGGLRVACIGLTRELTTRAARLAAFGAGAKVVATRSNLLTAEDAAELEALRPDIVLLAGGTDGGDKKTIIRNAETLAATGDGISSILAAGNKSARDAIGEIFSGTGKQVLFAKNILPRLGELDTEPVNEKIREIFLGRITASKGIDRAETMIGRVLMPTPSAVLQAARILADGVPHEEAGMGELLIVDVGGATTDVYSVAEGIPVDASVSLVGLREPRIKRTVEGDLGLYHNLDSLVSAAGGREADVAALRARLSVPEGADAEKHVELTRLAVRLAVQRHCGTLEPLYTGAAVNRVQRGKDLTGIPAVIGAGGPIVFSPDCARVLSGAVKSEEDGDALKPKSPALYRDGQYILFAAGLLSETEPLKALHLMKKYITPVC